ncbi:EAL domain-containing protein [Niveibacterium sp. 24ML]|uniref:putative bifunctional diguanylate cyclase/phosphodiesterase n=1 Tax=Niveibacterium sp. 24ML TaxID=2985512 RepID=UPI002271A68B|nr:EAL domain-containing protein [Niveibacterium sp. 24ML]MCX9157141.1 EAL domain-containing protein [Niveibacterium sp. 24ML]
MSEAQNHPDDELEFIDDEPEAESGGDATNRKVWRVLIVDDDPDVHHTTLLAMRNQTILHRQIQFLHTYSALQTRELLLHERDIAVILLDVVMENEDAGLRLVKTIREDLSMPETRIILRTGQPGYAPEIDAIRDYDINDYKTKSELTRNKLYTTLTAAIRSYEQIRTINAGRRGLDMIVRASADLMQRHGVRNFAAGVITQIAGLLGLAPEGLVCAHDTSGGINLGSNDVTVIAAAGRYADLINRPVDSISDAQVRQALERCLQSQRNLYDGPGTTLFFHNRHGDVAAYLDTRESLDDIDRRLLEVFCVNIAVGFDNAALFSRLNSFAYFDQLSRLPNRAHFIQHIDRLLAAPDHGKQILALVDLDHFAETNDALGHRFGDRLLQEVASRLKQSVSPRVIVARISGDTFGLLGASDDLSPTQLMGLFNTPFTVDGQELMVSITCGVLNLADAGNSGAEALKDANIALKRAKQGNRGEVNYFTREMSIEIQERVKLLQALRHAFDNERLFMVYQPQVNLVTRKAIGLEALIRWRDDDGKMVPPDRFIPLAEHSGLIVNIGEWITRVACHQQARLARAGYGHLRMAINVSVSQFRHPRFPFMLKRAIEDSGCDPACIELEITESMAMVEADFLLHTLDKLKESGITVAVDDFGTGFSSLSYLQRLNVDRLKIDRAFVKEITDSGRGSRIPEMVIQLSHKLGLEVIAEGVEDLAQADALEKLGCHEAQGYYFGRPMEPGPLMDWLSNQAV